MSKSLIIQYTNLLHRAEEFAQKHKGDEVFQKRVKVLKKLFVMKDKLLAPDEK